MYPPMRRKFRALRVCVRHSHDPAEGTKIAPRFTYDVTVFLLSTFVSRTLV